MSIDGGGLYRRKDSKNWWAHYYDVNGQRLPVSLGTPDERMALERLGAIRREVAARVDMGLRDLGPVSVQRYEDRWIADRRKRGVASVDDDLARLRHLPVDFKARELASVRVRHVRDAMAAVRSNADLAPRTVRHVYSVLRTMFSDAVADELLTETPCKLRQRRDELPANVDADPTWRDTAVYTREEVVSLVTDPRIPLYRRVRYGLVFIGAARFGEAAALTFDDWDGVVGPLGALSIIKTYDHRKGAVKDSTKTDAPRRMPVHPWLSALLSEWGGNGWAREFARSPKSNDLIIPSPAGRHLRPQNALRVLHQDCDLLGFRRRRMHDARRTFVSLALADGASKDLLQWATHGVRRDIMDVYTTPPWDALCREVAKLTLKHPQTENDPMIWYGTGTVGPEKKNPLQIRGLAEGILARSTGLEPVASGVTGRRSNQLN